MLLSLCFIILISGIKIVRTAPPQNVAPNSSVLNNKFGTTLEGSDTTDLEDAKEDVFPSSGPITEGVTKRKRFSGDYGFLEARSFSRLSDLNSVEGSDSDIVNLLLEEETPKEEFTNPKETSGENSLEGDPSTDMLHSYNTLQNLMRQREDASKIMEENPEENAQIAEIQNNDYDYEPDPNDNSLYGNRNYHVIDLILPAPRYAIRQNIAGSFPLRSSSPVLNDQAKTNKLDSEKGSDKGSEEAENSQKDADLNKYAVDNFKVLVEEQITNEMKISEQSKPPSVENEINTSPASSESIENTLLVEEQKGHPAPIIEKIEEPPIIGEPKREPEPIVSEAAIGPPPVTGEQFERESRLNYTSVPVETERKVIAISDMNGPPGYEPELNLSARTLKLSDSAPDLNVITNDIIDKGGNLVTVDDKANVIETPTLFVDDPSVENVYVDVTDYKTESDLSDLLYDSHQPIQPVILPPEDALLYKEQLNKNIKTNDAKTIANDQSILHVEKNTELLKQIPVPIETAAVEYAPEDSDYPVLNRNDYAISPDTNISFQKINSANPDPVQHQVIADPAIVNGPIPVESVSEPVPQPIFKISVPDYIDRSLIANDDELKSEPNIPTNVLNLQVDPVQSPLHQQSATNHGQIDPVVDERLFRNPDFLNSINPIDSLNAVNNIIRPSAPVEVSHPVTVNGHRYVKTSGTYQQCVFSSMNRHMDCYWGREPTEWCQTDRNTRWTREGCHCDIQVGACVIERSHAGRGEYAYCAPAANFSCPIPNNLFWVDEFGNKWLKRRKARS